MTKKYAVVFYNLGGPDAIKSVRPFLFNLFYDPAIISLPNPLRWIVAQIISRRRAPIAAEIYEQIGGKSPIVELTQVQAQSVAPLLEEDGKDIRCFVAMRYWKPFIDDVLQELEEYDPHEVLLIPLYPQYSTTTTGSFITAWKEAEEKRGISFPTKILCCYPEQPGFIEAHVALIQEYMKKAKKPGAPVRILFSAHGLPQKVVDKGDPYQLHVERTAEAIMRAFDEKHGDWRVCYQSRVGPLEWLSPSTEAAIKQAAEEGKAILLVPIAFVSEHSETLVELDIEYKKLAEEHKAKAFIRVPALGNHPAYMKSLAQLCKSMMKEPAVQGCKTYSPGRYCTTYHQGACERCKSVLMQ